MSLDYIIDGYNIIYSDDKFLSKTLEGKRNNLINFLSDKRPQGSSKNKTIVVFDGREEYPGDTRARKSVIRGIDIVFSVGRSADEEIVEIASPTELFDNPQHDRTKLFLSQILQH